MVTESVRKLKLAVREARVIRVSLLVAAGMNLLAWAVHLWFVLPRIATAPFFALHYTVYFGVDRIGAPWRLLALPLIGLLFLVVNAFVAGRLYVHDRLAAVLVMTATVFFEAMLLWTGFLNVLLNV